MPPARNVLLVVADQLNPSVLAPYGGPVRAPNLARLAAEGTRFTAASCTTPFCSPSRASLVTGRYPHAHGITHNVFRGYPAVESPSTEMGIRTDDETIGKRLHAAGFDTHHVGKWHLEDDHLPYYDDQFTEHHGYAQEMADAFREVRRRPREEWMDWYGWPLPTERADAVREATTRIGDDWEDLPFAEFVTKMGRLELDPGETFDVRLADRAVEHLRSADAPFFLTASFNMPHDPNVVPSPYYEAYPPAEIDLPETFDALEERFADDWSREIVERFGADGVREFLRIYYGAVELVDDQVGRLLDALAARGALEDTVVCFVSDHGDMAGEHGMVWKSTESFYDGVTQVPLFIRLPRGAGRDVVDLPCDLTDVAPTLLDAVGEAVPEGVQGESLLPYVTGEADPAARERYAFCERVETDPLGTRRVGPDATGAFLVRGREFEYARYADGEEYLYDLSADPGETANLAVDDGHADRKRALETELRDWLDRTGFPGRSPA